ncbi:unnamed protein product [Protopolystoma xenopodis]|uniref:Uncharacterized protein n=1 Tax=Protopolystoma xenopodis TaxID=117903 RepID=A0A448X524_9PLAT|nr:unnamed protein product [Protopolystoma xenopodis]
MHQTPQWAPSSKPGRCLSPSGQDLTRVDYRLWLKSLIDASHHSLNDWFYLALFHFTVLLVVACRRKSWIGYTGSLLPYRCRILL